MICKKKGHKIIFYAFFILFVYKYSYASNSSLFSSSGKIEYRYINYYKENQPDDSSIWNELIFYPKIKFNGTNSFIFFAEGLFRENFEFEPRSRYTIKEAYTSIYMNYIDLKIGKQIISWGVADEIKPLDYFKRYDYTDLIDKEEDGLVAVRSTYFMDRSSFDFVWSPSFESHKISFDPQNPWSGLQQQEVSVVFNNSYKPSRNIRNSQFGLRIEHQGEGMDFSFIYVYGLDRFPTIVNTNILIISETGAIVEIMPSYRRIHLFGADLNKSFISWNLKGEIAYISTEDSTIDPYIKGVLGAERYFSHLWSDIEIFVLSQFAFDHFFGDKKQSDLTNGLDYIHIFDYAATLNLDVKFSESYNLNIKGIIDLEDRGGILQTEFRWKPRNSLIFYIGADFLSGKDGTYFGTFKKNDRVHAGLRLDF